MNSILSWEQLCEWSLTQSCFQPLEITSWKSSSSIWLLKGILQTAKREGGLVLMRLDPICWNCVSSVKLTLELKIRHWYTVLPFGFPVLLFDLCGDLAWWAANCSWTPPASYQLVSSLWSVFFFPQFLGKLKMIKRWKNMKTNKKYCPLPVLLSRDVHEK